MAYEKKLLTLQWGGTLGGSCTVELYDINVLLAEDNNGVPNWTAQVDEAELVRALMSRYPGFHEFVANYGDIGKEQYDLMEEYNKRAREASRWYDERIERINKRAADIKKLNILMGAPDPEGNK